MFLGAFGVVMAQTEEEKGIRFLDNVAWKQVMEEAIVQEKMIFVDCYTSWCGPCKMLAKQVFPLPKVGEFFNAKFVNVKYDMEKPEGVALNKLYNGEVKNYPTMMVIDPRSGEILHKFVGKRSAEELIFEAKQGLTKRGEKSLDERYTVGERDFLFIKDYVLYLSLTKQQERLVEVIDRYFTENESFDVLLKDGEKWKFFSAYLDDFQSDFVQYVIKNFSRLGGLSFVNRDELLRTLAFRVLEGSNRLVKMCLEDGQLVPFKEDPELREMLGKSLQLLPTLTWRENNVALVKLYDRLIAKDWDGAFELLTYMQVFEFDKVLRGNYWNVCAYIAERCGDRKLQRKILASMELTRQEGMKMPSFNKYDYEAFVRLQMGDKKGAEEAMAKYKERQAKQDRVPVRKIQSHKRRK